jgi:hypothetical protein
MHPPNSIGEYKLTDENDPLSKLVNSLEKSRDIGIEEIILPIISFRRNSVPDELGIFHYIRQLFGIIR